MKHIKSYETFLNEAADKAKEIEKKVNKMGEVSDDEKELEKDMDASKDKNETPKAGTKSEDDNEAKDDKLKDDAPKDEIKEAAKNEDHEELGDELANMTISKMLDMVQKKDPDAYKDMEAYIKKNFVKAAKEGNFFTTMTA